MTASAANAIRISEVNRILGTELAGDDLPPLLDPIGVQHVGEVLAPPTGEDPVALTPGDPAGASGRRAGGVEGAVGTHVVEDVDEGGDLLGSELAGEQLGVAVEPALGALRPELEAEGELGDRTGDPHPTRQLPQHPGRGRREAAHRAERLLPALPELLPLRRVTRATERAGTVRLEVLPDRATHWDGVRTGTTRL